MSRTGTNVVRIAIAALLGVAACLVAWWPQSAAGTGDLASVSQMAAAPTQKTPTPTRTPTATVAPTTAAPPPAAPATSKPTKKPTKKPTPKPTRKPTNLHNNGGNNGGSNGGGSSNNNPPASNQGSSGSTSAPYVPPPAPSSPVAPATKPSAPQSSSASVPTAAPTTEVPTPDPLVGSEDLGEDETDTYDAYLSSSEPVQAKSAPVWVVPGILLVLTAMLALLGGVLGRGSRPAVATVTVTGEHPGDGGA